ncbi:hypothetical protein FKM82_011392 [Ascaphus truei]
MEKACYCNVNITCSKKNWLKRQGAQVTVGSQLRLPNEEESPWRKSLYLFYYAILRDTQVYNQNEFKMNKQKLWRSTSAKKHNKISVYITLR